ncbi:MAG: hypothetical protein QNJ32_08410 [Xenococcaceae cyanobacterium MO_167.B27]|nr:hypothetical protein [Xenococcaceae cyanobacterium MO_167.B27]
MKLSGMRSHYIIPLKDAKVNVKNLLTPNPRTVSQLLLKRDKFIPATWGGYK